MISCTHPKSISTHLQHYEIVHEYINYLTKQFYSTHKYEEVKNWMGTQIGHIQSNWTCCEHRHNMGSQEQVKIKLKMGKKSKKDETPLRRVEEGTAAVRGLDIVTTAKMTGGIC